VSRLCPVSPKARRRLPRYSHHPIHFRTRAPGFSQVNRVSSHPLGPARSPFIKPVDKLAEDALPVTLAACFVADFGRDYCHDTNDLGLRCKPVRIEVVGRPGQVVVHAVETKAKPRPIGPFCAS
jgi:hypothetical protein